MCVYVCVPVSALCSSLFTCVWVCLCVILTCTAVCNRVPPFSVVLAWGWTARNQWFIAMKSLYRSYIQGIWESTLERSLLFVSFVAKHVQKKEIWRNTWEFTQKRSNLLVEFVAKDLEIKKIWRNKVLRRLNKLLTSQW